jgi:uncharacterized protein (DUF433 family)
MDSITVNHIDITPGVCGGKPRIAGHRIRVQDVVIWHEAHGLSADEIVDHYPSITLADVYATLVYYHDHREDIRRDIAEGEAFTEDLKQQYPSKLRERLNGRHAGADSIPPR